MSKVILLWTYGCIIMGAEEPDSSSHLCHWQVESCCHIKKGFVLDFLGITEAPWEDVEKDVTMFMNAAYGGLGMTMSKCHKWLWAQKTARSHAAPKLASLPPTTEGFLQSAKRVLKSDPPSLSPLDYG